MTFWHSRPFGKRLDKAQEQQKTDNNMNKEKQEQAQEQTTPLNEQEAVKSAEASEPKEESKKDKKKKHEKQDDTAQKMQEMGEKLAEMNDKYLRLYSEFDNFRKRTNAEKADLILNGGKDVLKAVLPVVDDLERALLTMDQAGDQGEAYAKMKEGVGLVYNKLMNTLQQKGVKPIEAKGLKFDENLHEAITQFPAADESQKGMVVDVTEKGYYLNDKVLRYAKVVVAI